ncbi:GerAB/ArcD/ProY family transporter [Clostridium sp. DL1XJH146]
MVKNEKISAIQLISLILLNRILFGFSFMPTVTMAPANQDAWIVDILSGPMIIFFAIPLLILSSRFPNMAFNEYYQVILGKKLGKLVSVVYSIYLIFISLITVLLLSDFLLSAVLPETPDYAILLFMIIPCCYATYKGLQCICRTAVTMTIFVLFIIVIYAILNFNNMDFKVFLPILSDTSISEITFSCFNNATRFCDCFLFFSFIPYVKKTKNHSITKILIILVSAFILTNTFITIVTQAVLGVGLARIMKFPYYSSIQQINVFNIIQRIEFFNVIGWIIVFFFKISSTILAAAMIMAQVFKVKSYKPFVIPMNFIIVIIILLTNISHYAILKSLIKDYAYLIIFTVNFIIPSIVLIVYFFRRKTLLATSKLLPNK